MPNRVGTLTTFAGSAPPWSLPSLDANFSAISSALNDSSLGYNNYIGVDTGGANNYVVNCTFGVPTVYNVGMTLTFKPAVTNTGASTIAINSLGTAPIQHGDGTACIGGEIQAGKNITLIYNGTAFQIQGPPFGYGTSLYYDYDDFLFCPAGVSVSGSTKLFELLTTGNGTIVPFTTPLSGHPGILSIQSGTTSAKFTGLASAQYLFIDTFTTTIRALVTTPSVIDANEVLFGLTSSNGIAAPANSSIFFIGNSSVGVWQMWTSNGSTGTGAATSAIISAGNWYDLSIVITAAGATFFVNGSQVGTQSATFPSASAAMQVAIGFGASGGVNRSMAADLFEISVTGIPILPGSTNPRFAHGLV